MIQKQQIPSNITTTDQTNSTYFCQLEFMTLNFQALNTPTMGTPFCDVTVTFKQQGQIETIFFLNKKYFST